MLNPNPTIRIVPHGSPEYRGTTALRYELLRRPLGLGFDADMPASEADDIHIAAFDGDELIGCLVLTPLDRQRVRMRQVAVREKLQGRGIGRSLVIFSEQAARRAGFDEMVLHARQHVVPFYERLGYEIVGEPFEEVTIPHRMMRKSLRI